MYRKYYSYNDMPRPLRQGSEPAAENHAPSIVKPSPPKHTGLLGGLSNDDLILAAVLLILLHDGCDDKLLLAAIGFLLLGDL